MITKARFIIAFINITTLLAIGPVCAAQGNQNNQSQFGDFEVLNQLPAFQQGQGNNVSIDEFVDNPNPAVRFIGAIVTFITAVIIVISLLAIMVAGYIYMTAGGDATKVSRAKTIIVSALLGIVLALTAVIVLRAINPALVPVQDPFG